MSIYGATQLAGEHVARATLGKRVAILRAAWVYSATGSKFVRAMLDFMKRCSVRVIADQLGNVDSSCITRQGHLAHRGREDRWGASLDGRGSDELVRLRRGDRRGGDTRRAPDGAGGGHADRDT